MLTDFASRVMLNEASLRSASHSPLGISRAVLRTPLAYIAPPMPPIPPMPP
ncbi:hypothetical protein HLRTI_001828, partial [Halorhabdus tiamatea SARL4B]